MPMDFNLSAIAAMILEDAKGVAFLGPENPKEPAEADVMTFPAMSVTQIRVLLYEARM